MTSAPVGGLVPGVLSTGVKTPHVPYRGGGFTATKLYGRVVTAPQTNSLTFQIRRGAEAAGTPTSLGTVTISAGSKYGSQAISAGISDGDYFDVNITQVGASPNEGSDLVWVVAP